MSETGKIAAILIADIVAYGIRRPSCEPLSVRRDQVLRLGTQQM